MKNFGVMLAGVFVIVSGGCSITFLVQGEPGSGVMSTESRNLPEFDAIEFAGAGKINVVCGEATTLSLTTDDNLQELFATEVEGNTLRIYNTKNISTTATPTFEITTPALSRMECNGSSNVTVIAIDGEQFSIQINGSGKVVAHGTADDVDVDIAGSGNADLSGLAAQSADLQISGSGKVTVNASQKLNVGIYGSGNIRYVGSPKVTKTVAGSGNVRQIAAEISVAADESDADDDESDDDEEEEPEPASAG